jgi:CBS domain-containing protein
MSTGSTDTLDTAATPATVTVARAGLWMLFVAHVIAAWGTAWDIQWHLLIGRDSFWIAPHVMIYSGVTLLVLVSFGVVAWMTAFGWDAGAVRFAGFTATPGWHVAAWGIALTVIAAPIDDLWHRLFGLDVTLWSPPHLLGIAGAVVNAAACWLIVRESYPVESGARRVALVVAGGLLCGALGFALQPGIRIAYVYGGVMFFTYPMLATLIASLPLVVTARLLGLRLAPVLAVLVMVAMGSTGAMVARAGFAWTRPVSYIAEEIAKDPTSPIAIAHEIARKNGTTPGGYLPIVVVGPLLAALAMSLVDARRRPIAATLAYGAVVFVVTGVALARAPAFAQSLPSVGAIVIAATITVLAALAAGRLARRVPAQATGT